MNGLEGFKKALDNLVMTRYPFLDSYEISLDTKKQYLHMTFYRNPNTSPHRNDPIYQRIELDVYGIFRMMEASREWSIWAILFLKTRKDPNVP